MTTNALEAPGPWQPCPWHETDDTEPCPCDATSDRADDIPPGHWALG